MIREQVPPRFDEDIKKLAQELCWYLRDSSTEEWRQLGRQIEAPLLGNGRPAHRPPSADITARNARIVEQVEYWKRQGGS
jgi:hypothetical protein